MTTTPPAALPAPKPGVLYRLWRLLTLPVRIAIATIWLTFGAWTALAAFFSLPIPTWLAAGIALTIFTLFATALREKLFIGIRPQSWRRLPLTITCIILWLITAAAFTLLIRPDPNLDWADDHARHPRVTFEQGGDIARVQNIRNFAWRTPTEFTPVWEERTYDLRKLTTMYYVIAPMFNLEGVAHVFVCFSFSDGQHVAISVEARRTRGRSYQPIASMFRQYQLIYVIGDERDVVGLRGVIWRNSLRFYPAATPPPRARAIFASMLTTGDALNESPEFYHLLTNNCLTNITRHIRALGGHGLPRDLAMVMTGLSDRVAHRLGFINTDLPFEEARRAFTIDDWMRTATLDEGFSARLRDHLRQVANHDSAIPAPETAPNPGK